MKKYFLCLIIFIGISIVNAKPVNEIDEENSEHTLYKNHVAIFLGGTTFYKNNESHFSLGLDYLYRPNSENPWAYSIMAEAIFAKHTEYVIALPIYHYIISEWWFRTGPGIEIIQEEEHHGDEVESKTQIEFLYRIGTGYSFHLGNFVLSPSVDLDFVRNNDALVWGLNIGYSF